MEIKISGMNLTNGMLISPYTELFYAIDWRKLKKLKRKYYFIELKDTVSYNGAYIISTISNLRLYPKLFIKKVSNTHIVYFKHVSGNQPMYSFFKNESSYLKWKLKYE